MARERLSARPLAPLDISYLCDGGRTSFPLGMDVDGARVTLNGSELQDGIDFEIQHRNDDSTLELRRPPVAGDTLWVARVPRSEWTETPDRYWAVDIPYEQLPQLVTDNLSPEQWREAQRMIVLEGTSVPEDTDYINLKNGQIHRHPAGQEAEAPLLAVHDLAGGRGKDSTQFHTSPPGGRGVP
jgi:hypothetical protein